MTRSVPGLDLARPEGAAARELFDAPTLARYDRILSEVAKPYRIRNQSYSRSEQPAYGLDAATGLVASAADLAAFEGSLDDREEIKDNIPIDAGTLAKLWTRQNFLRANPVTGLEETYTTPTGLGWFVQTSSNVPLVWTYGYIPDAGSALIVKMPSKSLTMILLSNSDGLVVGNNFERGDVTNSPFVKVFLRLFI
jgi:CubicO group peptidase (beta-lactamase class C family)